jgi:hypothetical protein
LLLQNQGWFLSLAFHVTVLACFSISLIRIDRDRHPLGIEGSLAEQDGAGGLENLLQTPSFEVAGAESSVSSSSAELSRQATDEAATRALGDLNALGFGTGASGDGTGDEGGGRAPGLGAGFFGAKGAGKSFVYVVDMSGSMEGDRFRRAIAELIRSINKLAPEQTFYVIFFNDKTFFLFDPQPAKGLIAANTSNKSRATRWIRNRRPSSTTDPMLALQKALAMKPEVIFLLTDGELDNPADVRHMISRENKTGVVIHTIAFENEEASATLETIAAENNGTFRLVK